MNELDKSELSNRDMNKKFVEEMEALCFSVFDSELGKTLLDKLFHYFIHTRVIAHPSQHANVAFYNEGQNGLIRLLKQCYKQGKANIQKANAAK